MDCLLAYDTGYGCDLLISLLVSLSVLVSLCLHSSALLTRHSSASKAPQLAQGPVTGCSYSSSGLFSTPAAEGSSSVSGPVRGAPRQQAATRPAFPWSAHVRRGSEMTWCSGGMLQSPTSLLSPKQSNHRQQPSTASSSRNFNRWLMFKYKGHLCLLSLCLCLFLSVCLHYNTLNSVTNISPLYIFKWGMIAFCHIDLLSIMSPRTYTCCMYI